jgi:hypothetical protein
MTPSNLCRILTAATLLAAISAPTYHGTAVAADPQNSNKGGEVRGTTRADDRAGPHGDQGRDRAETNQSKTKKGKSIATGNSSKSK